MDVWNHQLNKQASKALKNLGLGPSQKSLQLLDLMLWRLDVGPAVKYTARAMF